MRKYSSMKSDLRAITFYSEGRYDWPHLGPIVSELIERRKQPVCYLTSDEQDVAFEVRSPLLQVLYIGEGAARTSLFKMIDCPVFVMTMADLETFHLKRSAHPVHYVYVFHSIGSSHMTYRKKAIDAYDSVFCVGPHHIKEIRRAEQMADLKPKQLIEVGYSNLDSILSVNRKAPRKKLKTVLVASTWGPSSILDLCARPILENLLDSGYTVIFRPHSMSIRDGKRKLKLLEAEFGTNPNFSFDYSPSFQEAFEASDAMVSEWSGVALEYAFGYEKPVVFVDTPPKVNNPDFRELNIVPCEVAIRERLGKLVPLDQVSKIHEFLQDLDFGTEQFTQKIRKIREETVFNLGKSREVGADYIVNLL